MLYHAVFYLNRSGRIPCQSSWQFLFLNLGILFEVRVKNITLRDEKYNIKSRKYNIKSRKYNIKSQKYNIKGRKDNIRNICICLVKIFSQSKLGMRQVTQKIMSHLVIWTDIIFSSLWHNLNYCQ